MQKRVLLFVGMLLAVMLLTGTFAKTGGDSGNSGVSSVSNSGGNSGSSSGSVGSGGSDSGGKGSGQSTDSSSGNARGEDSNGKGSGETRVKSDVRTKFRAEVRGEQRVESETRREMMQKQEERLEVRIENMEEKMRKLEEFRIKLREREGTLRIEGRDVLISELTPTQKEIIAGRINARTDLNLTAAEQRNGTLLRAILSNGKFADVKVMPDRATMIALERMRAKCEERNCTVELKEVGIGNKTRAAWVVETEKESRVFLVFKKRMVAKAEIDPETGEIIRIKKPWWAFLAKEKHATRAEVEAEIEGNATVETVTVCHIPPGNPAARHTIVIGRPAVRAHLAHGDTLGPCSTGNGTGNETNGTITPSVNNTNVTLPPQPPINETNVTLPDNNQSAGNTTINISADISARVNVNL